MSTPPYAIILRPSSASSIALAKASLLDWAESNDARRPRSRTIALLLVAGGALGCVSGIALSRLRGPPRRIGAARRLIPWALLSRAGFWLLPMAVRAVRRSPASPPTPNGA